MDKFTNSKGRTGLILSGSVIVAASVIAYSLLSSKSESSPDQLAMSGGASTGSIDATALGELTASIQNINSTLNQFNSSIETLSERVNNLESSPPLETESNQRSERIQNDYQVVEPAEKLDYAVALQMQFQEEDIDPAWSQTSQIKFDTLFAQQDTPYYGNVDVANIECRSASCKVDLALQGSIEAEDFEFVFFVDASKQGFGQAMSSIDQTTGIRSYYLSAAPQRAPASNEQLNQILGQLKGESQ